MLSSHVKISPLLWLHNKSRLSHQKTIKVKWFGNVINRTLHGRLEIRNFSSRVEKIFQSFLQTGKVVEELLEFKYKYNIGTKLTNLATLRCSDL